MIPKTIHYCWFGRNPLPSLAIKCINSWKSFLPDYEIIEWNEDNFDVNIIPYTEQAYKAKKYAFVSDYARFWILYNYGGVYFDTDVELIASIDSILEKGPFMACEHTGEQWKEKYPAINAGLGLASEEKNYLIDVIINSYNKSNFIDENRQMNLTTVVRRVSSLLSRYNLTISSNIQKCDNMYIYPPDYFCPLNHLTGKLNITDNTISIHHYMGSWQPRPHKNFVESIWTKLHLPNTNIINRLKLFFKRK